MCWSRTGVEREAGVFGAFLADIVTAILGLILFGVDPLADWPAAGALLQRLAENPNVQTIARNRDAARPAFIEAVKARLAAAAAVQKAPTQSDAGRPPPDR